MKIGLAVTEFWTKDIDKNIKAIYTATKKAKKSCVDLICFGEAVLQGFFALSGNFESDKEIAISINSAPIRKIKAIAKDCGVAIAVGYLELDENVIFSSFLVVDKNGETLCNFRRVSPGWKEHHWGENYQEGKDFFVFNICGKVFTAGLCGDFWTDDKFLLPLQAAKAEIVLWPVFVDASYADWATNAILEYAEQAIKIGKHVLLINSILNEENIAQGRAAYFLDGKIQKQLGLGKKGMLICDI